MTWVHDITPGQLWTAECDHDGCYATTDQPRTDRWTVTPPGPNRCYSLHHCPEHTEGRV